MIADGRIVDAKTIMLLQYAALHIFQVRIRRVGKAQACPPCDHESCDENGGHAALCPPYDTD